MKTMIMALVMTLSLTTLANTVKGTNLFPGFGAVSSSLVCLTENTVRVTLPERTVKTCVKYRSPLLGHNCEKYKTSTKEAIVFEAPLSFEILGCLESKTEFDNSQVPKEVCTKTGMIMYHQPRTYIVAKPVQVDIFHTEIVYEERAIPACD